MPVSRVDPRLIGHYTEEFGLYSIKQALEARRVSPGVAHATVSQRTTGTL